MAIVRLSTPLRRFTGGKPEVEADGARLDEIISDLDRRYPGIVEKIMDGEEIQRFVNIYVNNEDVRLGEGLATKMGEKDIISILPAVSGG